MTTESGTSEATPTGFEPVFWAVPCGL